MKPHAGQALIEAAVTIPILVVLFLGFLAAGLTAQALVDLNTSVFLAAASAVTAPAVTTPPGTSAVGQQYAAATYRGSMSHVPELTNSGVSCSGSWDPASPTGYEVTCRATETLLLRQTPLGIVVPFNPILKATATAHGSPYRST